VVLKTFKLGGVHPPENKISEKEAIQVFDIPQKAFIPVAQVLGAPSTPLVNKGDQVKVGQLIAKGEAFISANVHSSVSGKVARIDEVIDTSGYRKKTIVIDVDGDEWLEGIDRSPEIKKDISHIDQKEIIEKIKESGIVGLGGATFPSHVKLMVPKDKKAEILLINGVECEPYLTSDHRLMLEKGEELLIGIQLLMKGLGVEKAVIGIEKNKADAIEHLTKLSGQFKGISVQPLKVKYPQGGEKQLIKAVINREVPSGKLPIEVGAVVNNVGTAFAVYEAIQKNKPLFERIVTVTGKNLTKTANFLVRIGTPISELIEKLGGLPEDTGKVISGGPMMGKSLNSLDVPVVKGTSGILLIPEKKAGRTDPVTCIRCGKCVSVCPMGLEPYYLAQVSRNANYEIAETNKIMDCIECGCCSYVCPSKIRHVHLFKYGKMEVTKMLKAAA